MKTRILRRMSIGPVGERKLSTPDADLFIRPRGYIGRYEPPVMVHIYKGLNLHRVGYFDKLAHAAEHHPEFFAEPR